MLRREMEFATQKIETPGYFSCLHFKPERQRSFFLAVSRSKTQIGLSGPNARPD